MTRPVSFNSIFAARKCGIWLSIDLIKPGACLLASHHFSVNFVRSPVMGTNCIFLIKSSKAITDFCVPFSYLSSPRLFFAKPFTGLHFIMPAECLIIFALVIRRLGDGRLIYCTNLIRALIVIDRSNLSIKPKALSFFFHLCPLTNKLASRKRKKL